MTLARGLRTTVLRGQFPAAVALPVLFVVGSVVAGGGLTMAGLTVVAIPLMGLFALAPALGRWVGAMRAPDDVPLGYAIVTLALWLAALPLGFLMTYTQPVPSYALEPAGYAAAGVASSVVIVAVALLGAAQTVLALVGVRARRRAHLSGAQGHLGAA